MFCAELSHYNVYLRQQLSVMQQFETSTFYKVVHWQKIGEVKNEYILHNFIILAIFVPKIIKFGWNLTKLWQKQFWLFFFWVTVYTKLTAHINIYLNLLQTFCSCVLTIAPCSALARDPPHQNLVAKQTEPDNYTISRHSHQQ